MQTAGIATNNLIRGMFSSFTHPFQGPIRTLLSFVRQSARRLLLLWTLAELLEAELGSDELLARVETTKFRRVPGFGRKGPGYIILQHHDQPAWFRSIKIRELH